MSKKNILLLFLSLSFLCVSAQKKKWLEEEYREKTWPSAIFYKQYSVGNNEKEAFNNAKSELSKSILTQVETKSNVTSITKNAIINDLFREKVSETSSATFVNLDKKTTTTKRKSISHVFIFKNKEDLKNETKNIFINLQNSYINSVSSLIKIYQTGNIKEAKNKSDQINKDQRKLERLKTFLSVFGSNIDLKELNSSNQKFDELKAKILRDISEEENYKINKDKADILFSSSDNDDLEKALLFYKNAQRINPEQAIADDLSADIEILRDNIFVKYCQKGQNYEEEKNYNMAVIFYKKARNIFQKREVTDEKYTTTEKIIECQNNQIDLKINQGNEELDDNAKIALVKFKEAKTMAGNMGRTDRIKYLNKLIKKSERSIRRAKIQIVRGESSRRLLVTIGGGFQTEYSAYRNIYSDPIIFNAQNWNLNTTLGYRMNLPDKRKVTKSGREISKGNVLAIFLKQGSTNVTDTENINFSEFEFGYIYKEWLRFSAGVGNRNKPIESDNDYLSNYYTTTGGITFHFGRISTDIGVTYLFNNDFEPIKATLNTSVSLKFYFYKKIYKTVKSNI